MSSELFVSLPTLTAPDARQLEPSEIAQMLTAGAEVRASMRALERVGLNLVGEVLKDQGDFVELEHYPRDDVFDDETYSQYYYHTHRSNHPEHGHFHTFVRAEGMPVGAKPLDYPLASEAWPQGKDAMGHLAGISMDAWGKPIGLFVVNRWVTAETWYSAETMIDILPRFSIEHAWPSWPVNRWISAMLRLYAPHIRTLLRHRDAVITAWQQAHPGKDVFEDRNLELTGYLPIPPDDWMTTLTRTLSRTSDK